jgi:hypothetical protein
MLRRSHAGMRGIAHRLSVLGTFTFKNNFGGMSIRPALVRREDKEAAAASTDQRRQDDARDGDGEGDEGL